MRDVFVGNRKAVPELILRLSPGHLWDYTGDTLSFIRKDVPEVGGKDD